MISEMPGFSPKAIVIDGRGHMLGRLASIVAKLLLSGNKVNLAFFSSIYLVCSFFGAGVQTRGAEINLPPGAGAKITNFGSGSLLFITDFLWEKTHGC